MYMPGRLRTPSRPFRTPIDLSSYVGARKSANLLWDLPSDRAARCEELVGTTFAGASYKGIMCRISRGNLAIFDAVIGPVSRQQNMALVGGRDEALAGLRREVLEQVRVARWIELARHVIEQQDRQVAVRAREHRELRGLPREHDRAQLALRREAPGLAAVELEREVVAMRPELRRLRREILRAAARDARARICSTRRAGELRHVARARRALACA